MEFGNSVLKKVRKGVPGVSTIWVKEGTREGVYGAARQEN